MKKIFTLIVLLICLPAFASNNLQKQYEGDLTQNLPYQNAMYVINDDFKAYYSDGGSLYGILQHLSQTCKNQNKKVDLSYIEVAISNLMYAYGEQTDASLSYIEIDDENYGKLTMDTKKAIKAYNTLAMLSKRVQIDYNTYNNQLIECKNKFLSNKNDIKSNYELQSLLYNSKEQLNEYIKDQKSRGNYTDVDDLEKLSKDIEKLCLEIYNYSYAYEKKKYQNWLIKNNKKPIGGTLQQFVYDGRYQPQKGYIYTHDPKDLFLIVKQTVPGGVIVSGRHDIGGGFHTINDIFLQTTKSFADGAYITEPIFAEYKGFYDYTTVMGARRRIYKFYRYGQNEIKANFQIPSEKFYFYGWDGKWY